MAIRTYKNKETMEIALGIASKESRKILPIYLHKNARSKLAYLDGITSFLEIFAINGFRAEKLSGSRIGQYSIRVNSQYRICFNWENGDFWNVEIVDYH